MHSKQEKQRLRRFMVAKELVMVSLVLVSLGFLILEHIVHLSHEQLVAVDIIEVTIACIFLFELIFEWYHAKDRWKYFKEHWFYVLAAIPVPTYLFEALRGIRLLRLLRLMKLFAHLRYEENTKLFERGAN